MAQGDKHRNYYAILSFTLIVVWIISYATRTLPTPISLFCGFVGLLMHYIYDLRTAEIGARLFFKDSPFTIKRAQSRFFFILAAIVEGAWVTLLLLCVFVL